MTAFSCIQSHSKCFADLCGALHCDLVMNSRAPKAKCNPAAVVRNRHLCEVVLGTYLLVLFQSVFFLVIASLFNAVSS